MQSAARDPQMGDGDDERAPEDRDERRIEALERLFRSAHEGERQLDAAAMRKLGAALRGEAPGE
jgi:hypothetical protein